MSVEVKEQPAPTRAEVLVIRSNAIRSLKQIESVVRALDDVLKRLPVEQPKQN